MSIWRREPLTENPYLRTAFRIAKAPREAIRRLTLARLIQQAKQVAVNTPEARSIMGRPVTPEDVNAAEGILLKPEQRILEELLVHSTEGQSQKRLRKLAQQTTAAIRGPMEDPTPPDHQGLRLLMRDLVAQQVAHAAQVDPFFGVAELDLIPPFGAKER